MEKGVHSVVYLFSYPLLSGGDLLDLGLDQKTLVGELKTEWRKLWAERVDDKLRAEGVAKNDYSMLNVDRGTIIHATRNYKPLDFKEILKRHEVENAERFIPPEPQVGGWNRFIKDNISRKPIVSKRAQVYQREIPVKQQLKKGGRGWLHKIA
jgi:hypothetical protein